MEGTLARRASTRGDPAMLPRGPLDVLAPKERLRVATRLASVADSGPDQRRLARSGVLDLRRHYGQLAQDGRRRRLGVGSRGYGPPHDEQVGPRPYRFRGRGDPRLVVS